MMADRLPEEVRHAVRFFAFALANGTVAEDLVGTDYRESLVAFGSELEMVFAIFLNVLRLDSSGSPVNEADARERAADWIRSYHDSDFIVDPPFEDWEVELH